MKPSERLTEYYPFNDIVLEAVDKAAHDQNAKSFHDLADEHGLSDGPERVHPHYDKRTVEYLHITPKGDYDETSIRLYQAPMGIPADESTAMRAIRLFGSEPTTQLMVVGSPSVLGNRANLLKRNDMKEVANGDLKPAVRPVLQHLFRLGIVRAQILGYSYGADAGAAFGQAANEYAIEIDKSVLMEPAGVEERSVLQLVKDFHAGLAALQGYIDATESRPLFEARNTDANAVSSSVSFLKWAGGLMRGTNIAIAKGIGKGTFADTAAASLEAQKRSKLAIIWGSKSEMVHPAAIEQVMHELTHHFQGRVIGMEMNGMHHGGGDDIDLHAAMALQGLIETN